MTLKLIVFLLLLVSPAAAQLFYETFESATCDETWADGCPSTVTNATTMTGDYYLSRSDTSDHIVKNFTAVDEKRWQFQLRRDDKAADFILQIGVGASGVCQVQMDSSDGSLRMDNSGGTDSGSISFAVNTNVTFDVYAKKGAGTDAECRISDDDGATWQTSNDGTWTGQVDRIQIEGATGVVLGWDEIRECDNNTPTGVCMPVSRTHVVSFSRPAFMLNKEAPDPPAPPEWVRSFTALDEHYVDDVTCGGVGTIGDPECLADADGTHADPGDLHILRAGTYQGVFSLGSDCTSANPCAWRWFIDSDGNPEQAIIDGGLDVDGEWNWVMGVQCGDTDDSHSTTDGCIRLQARGASVINSIVKDHDEHSGVTAFNFGPDMVVYGAILINNGADDTGGPAPHNIYTQNTLANGTKYFVQMISLDQTTAGNRFNFHAFTTGNAIQDMHIQDSVFQNGRFLTRDDRMDVNGDIRDIVIKDNLFVDMNVSQGFQLARGTRATTQVEMTGNILENSKIFIDGLLGVGDLCGHSTAASATTVTGNKVWNPLGGKYVEVRTSRGNAPSGSVCCTSSPSECVTGTPKILDSTVWNSNTYGPSGSGNVFDLHANGSDNPSLTFAQWKTESDNARETAGGTEFDAAGSETTVPTSDEVRCYDNDYEDGWGYCWGIDWDGNNSITINGTEADKIIGNSKTYTVRDVRDFFGTALQTGTYTAGAGLSAITLPGTAEDSLLIVWITSQP